MLWLKVQRHFKAFIGLFIRVKWFLEDVPFYVKMWPKLAHPFKNADFRSVLARCASTVTASEKSSINKNR